MGNPRWHIQGDALDTAYRYEWDMMIAFPPCTYLSAVNARNWKALRQRGLQQHAAWFFKALYMAPIPHVAIENPAGYMNTHWRKPDQIINPYQFGDPWTKRTCLWLKDLPLLQPTNRVSTYGPWVSGGAGGFEGAHHSVLLRSRTFRGIARAMADQWGSALV